MLPRPGERRLQPRWWTLILVSVIIGILVLTAALFEGWFRPAVPVTLESDRSGLVMEPGGKVKLRGVEVGRVAEVSGRNGDVALKLELNPDQLKYIPANVEAQIRSTTAFGAKFVDLVYPANPSKTRLSSGSVLKSTDVTPELNSVFQNIVDLLDQVDPAKLNSTITALAEGFRGQGDRMGEATVAANQTLIALNARTDTIRDDFRALGRASDAYAAAAPNILTVLNAATTTSTTLVSQSDQLDSALLAIAGLSRSGTNLVGPNQGNIVHAINVLEPTTALLLKYNPTYTCTLQGAVIYLNNGGLAGNGGRNGKSSILDAGLLLGDDPYRYPDNLPIVNAKGGPGGKPGCGSLPDVAKQYPVRALVMDTGFGTGLDIRPNPGIGFPGYVNYFPVTRGIPVPPRIAYEAPAGPAPGPEVAPGQPPYGAALYGPGGDPLWPGLPPAPAPAPAAADTASEPTP